MPRDELQNPKHLIASASQEFLDLICALERRLRDVRLQVEINGGNTLLESKTGIHHLLCTPMDPPHVTSLPDSFLPLASSHPQEIQTDDPDIQALYAPELQSDHDPYQSLCDEYGVTELNKVGLSREDFDSHLTYQTESENESHFLIDDLDDENFPNFFGSTRHERLRSLFLRKPLLVEILKTLKKISLVRKIQYRPYNWQKNARSSQLEPRGKWRVWLIMAGRGFGKTRTGSETIRTWVSSGRYKRIALIGASESEARDVMIEGESGLLSVFPTNERPIFEPSKRRLTFQNGAIATLFSAENYEQLRGPQFDAAWVDELAKFRNDEELWTQLNLSLRLGTEPKVIVTTTPRTTELMRHLLHNQKSERVHLTRGSTFENKKNLSKNFLRFIKEKYQNTQLGEQELEGNLLEQVEGALFPLKLMASTSIAANDIPELKRLVVAIDPAVTSGKTSDETGIIVAGCDAQNKAYILGDFSGRYRPQEWALKALEAYDYFKADAIVAEVNQGGDMVCDILHSLRSDIPIRQVYASRGKAARAEPVVALYEQGRVKHKRCQSLKALETQMINYIPGVTKKSPDRLDALVWAVTELLLQKQDKLEKFPRLLGTL